MTLIGVCNQPVGEREKKNAQKRRENGNKTVFSTSSRDCNETFWKFDFWPFGMRFQQSKKKKQKIKLSFKMTTT